MALEIRERDVIGSDAVQKVSLFDRIQGEGGGGAEVFCGVLVLVKLAVEIAEGGVVEVGAIEECLRLEGEELIDGGLVAVDLGECDEPIDGDEG